MEGTNATTSSSETLVPSLVAVMRLVLGAAAVTTPFATVATAVTEDAHSTVRPLRVLSEASRVVVVAVSVAVAPGANEADGVPEMVPSQPTRSASLSPSPSHSRLHPALRMVVAAVGDARRVREGRPRPC